MAMPMVMEDFEAHLAPVRHTTGTLANSLWLLFNVYVLILFRGILRLASSSWTTLFARVATCLCQTRDKLHAAVHPRLHQPDAAFSVGL